VRLFTQNTKVDALSRAPLFEALSRRELVQMARIAETWDKVNTAAGEVAEYNLERKPLVFSVFPLLAAVARS
jgi:DNA polymerase-3 subunit delta'